MNIVSGRGNNLPWGKVSPPQPSCMLSFLCYDKENEKSTWLFVVSEKSSRGYLKHFLISRPYEDSQWGGGVQSTPG